MKTRLIVTLVVAAFSLSGQVQAGSISVANHSFEEPVLSAGAFDTNVQDWIETGDQGAGTWFPNGKFTVGPDGNQAAYSNGAVLSQTLARNVAEGHNYELDVLVGLRNDRDPVGWRIELWGGTHSIATLVDTTGATLVSGEFVNQTIDYIWDFADAAAVGQALEIRLVALDDQISFDNVRLDVQPVPLPASVVLLASSLTGLGLIRRRRKGTASRSSRNA